MVRLWHVEHRDGRPWTRRELDEVVWRARRRDGLEPHGSRCMEVTVDDLGHVYLLDNYMRWHCMTWNFPDDGDGMVVAIDG